MEVLFDSRKRFSETANSCRLRFPSRLSFSKIRLNYVSLFNTWHNLASFVFTLDTQPKVVPAGQYDLQSLAAILDATVKTVNAAYSVTTTGNFTLVWNVGTIVASGAAANLLGIALATGSFTSVPDLSGVQSVLFRCNQIKRKAPLASDGFYTDSALCSVPIFAPQFSQNFYAPLHSDILDVLEVNSDIFEFDLTDQSDNALLGRASEWVMSLTVE